jgi:hypothetical protein
MSIVMTMLSLLAALGCQKPEQPFREIDPNRLQVNGTVTFKGQPADGIFVSFEPVQKGPVASGAKVENGKFHMDAADGLVPATYRVKFYDLVSLTGGDPGATDETEKKPRIVIPPQYGEKSTLTVEVKPGINNTFKFEIK